MTTHMLDDGTIVVIQGKGTVTYVRRFDPERIPTDSRWHTLVDIYPDVYEEEQDDE